MDSFPLNTTFVVLGFVAIIVEMLLGAATGFDLFIIGAILIISGALGNIVDSTTLSMILIPVLSVMYVMFGRGFIKQRLAISTKSTNTDALIGRKGIITKKVSKNTAGRIKIDSEVWRVTADEAIDEGVEAVVQSVSGVTVHVKVI